MGFGSYDESDQRSPEVATDDEGADDVDVHENEYDGTLTYDSAASTTDLLSQLQSIKEDAAVDPEDE